MNLESEVRYLILALQREGNRQLLKALSPVGITPSQAEVISILARRGDMSLNALGQQLVCESGESPSRLVERLVSKGLVMKTKSKDDRRAVSLTLSPQGQLAFTTSVKPIDVAMEGQIRSALSEKDLRQLHILLSKFAEAIPRT